MSQSSGSGGYFAINKLGTVDAGYTGGVNAVQLWSSANAPMLFATNSAERLRIASGGNVQVNGGALHLDANGEFAIFEQDTALTMTNSSKISMDFASNVARIRSSHNGSGGNSVSRPLSLIHI